MSVTAADWEAAAGMGRSGWRPSARAMSGWLARHGRGFFLRGVVAALGIVWGLQISLLKLTGEEHGATSGGLLFIHLVLLGIFVPVLLAKGKMFLPRLDEAVFYAISAVIGSIVPLWLELTVAPQMSAGLLTLICSMAPIVTVLFVLIIRSERVGRFRLAGVVVGVASASALIVPQAVMGSATPFWIAIAFALPVLAALEGIYINRLWPEDRSIVQVTAGTLVAGTAMILPVHLATSAAPVAELSHGPLSLPLLALTLSIALEFYLYSLLIRKGGAVLTSCSDFVAVLAGFGWGYLIFGERLGMDVWLAAGLGMIALWLICHEKKTHGPAH